MKANSASTLKCVILDMTGTSVIQTWNIYDITVCSQKLDVKLVKYDYTC